MHVLAIATLSALAIGLVIVGRPPRGVYRTVPAEIERMPSGIPFIVGNEMAERFAFYGMKGVLVVFMTHYLLGADGEPAPMGEEEAKSVYHLFSAAAFFTPVFGAVLADWLFGKYRLILGLSVVYCAGNLVLAYDQTRTGLLVGLTLIAVASGGIKPLCTAHVADQFGLTNQRLFPIAMKCFYAAINAGALASVIVTPLLLEHVSSQVTFAVPAVLMFVATVVFWLGRNRFVHAPPTGRDVILTLEREGPALVRRLLPALLMAVIFFACFEQQGSAFVLQAQKMDTVIFGIKVLPAQLQAVNPLCTLIMIPLVAGVIYPLAGRFVNVTPLGKACAGCVLMVICFLILAYVQHLIDLGERPHVTYHLVVYLIITAAEVMFLVTLMEYSCQKARRLRSLAMSAFLLSLSAGNLFTAAVNFVIIRPDDTSRLEGPDYFLFFSALMAVTAVGFGWLAWIDRGQEVGRSDPDPLQ